MRELYQKFYVFIQDFTKATYSLAIRKIIFNLYSLFPNKISLFLNYYLNWNWSILNFIWLNKPSFCSETTNYMGSLFVLIFVVEFDSHQQDRRIAPLRAWSTMANVLSRCGLLFKFLDQSTKSLALPFQVVFFSKWKLKNFLRLQIWLDNWLIRQIEI